MASFNEENFIKKLVELKPTEQSIQTLSLWLIHHRKRSRMIVGIWIKELKKAHPNRKLTYLYLANDVVQNSRKKGTDFIQAFHSVMHEAYKQTAKDVDDKTKASMGRMVKVWGDRKIFSDTLLQKLKQSLEKPKVEPPKKKKKKELSLLEEVESDLTSETDAPPPETEDLVHALEELATSASSDAAVRQTIADLPAEVSDVALLQKLEDRQSAEKLATQAEEAKTLLEAYNQRLSKELDDRKNTAKQLRRYINDQKDALTKSEKMLQEYRGKLAQIAGVRKELKTHMQNLPEIPQALEPVGGLAPLPLASDLFV